MNKTSEQMLEIHPWNWYGAPTSRTLIVGTFPPTKKNWSFDFFYPNKRNLFWKIIANIRDIHFEFESGAPAVEERKKALDELGITITDMGQSISRIAGNSLDENLNIIQFMDIFKILETYPLIDTIIFTSSSGKVSAVRWFEQYSKTKGINIKLKTTPKPTISYVEWNGKPIQLVVLFSPSARAANRIAFSELCSLYRDQILR